MKLNFLLHYRRCVTSMASGSACCVLGYGGDGRCMLLATALWILSADWKSDCREKNKDVSDSELSFIPTRRCAESKADLNPHKQSSHSAKAPVL